MALRWDPHLSTGIEEIDREHQELLKRLSRLYNAARGGQSKEEIEELLAYLTDYTKRHFAMEETFMEGSDYPGLAEHRHEHELFLEELLHITESFLKRGASSIITIKLMTCMTRWLREHIYGHDKKMAEALRSAKKP